MGYRLVALILTGEKVGTYFSFNPLVHAYSVIVLLVTCVCYSISLCCSSAHLLAMICEDASMSCAGFSQVHWYLYIGS
jgi:hypothetical protein